eukprot:755558-Prorocentrum_minimum.AAC.1
MGSSAEPDLSKDLLGRRVECFWKAEGQWFTGVLTKSKVRLPGAYRVAYDDGDFEELILPDDTIRLLDENGTPETSAKPAAKANAT